MLVGKIWLRCQRSQRLGVVLLGASVSWVRVLVRLDMDGLSKTSRSLPLLGPLLGPNCGRSKDFKLAKQAKLLAGKLGV